MWEYSYWIFICAWLLLVGTMSYSTASEEGDHFSVLRLFVTVNIFDIFNQFWLIVSMGYVGLLINFFFCSSSGG